MKNITCKTNEGRILSNLFTFWTKFENYALHYNLQLRLKNSSSKKNNTQQANK